MSAATIQLVTPDLTHQETILQIVDALDHLDKVTDEVFSNIQAKIQQNATKLADLDSRVDVADQKVKALAEMNQKATCIYSSAKYPEQEEQDYVSAFKDIDQRIDFVKNTSIKVKKPDINLKGLDAKEINEKRRYFHLPVKKKPTTAQLLEESPDLRLPSKNAKSALSYLIFNTAENPYAKTKDFSNPLNNQKTKSKKEEEATDKTSLGEAPASLGIGLDDADGTSDLFFAPALGDLPDLDLPDILDLPNLPTDLSYMTDLGPGIAPSVQQIPDLYLPGDDGIPEDAEALLAAPPPPPPPSLIPPPPVPTSAPVASSIPPPVPELTTIPKLELPPAAPPPPVAPPPLEDIPDAPKETAPSVSESGGGGRASLMEAIRNAGGSSKAGLKSVKELKMEEKKAKQEGLENAGSSSKASGGGDLMSDLASKLAMRRKGISGKPEGGSTMDKMSMMIPTLPEDPDEGQDDDDDDWS